ncbi:hypothetical protein JANAI62_18910 [Jannaschia pagri]|uniref:DUF2793 domain-containing protein n=1 Tax=Jannaschia pagri TaxID=2829797 RepID=A0ABQ4NLI6_9RHOB|nr:MULTISPECIES: DUF2793 domain-containing protein [unclassified Jannaschia]GIT91434.1 hypothetical protein JANAI61_18920 [Jannaschia sp. AI_61]GIT95268.1 hypothetical protein JANAI62_18910 [Jannaschia sp. AI_62]
MSQTTPILDLPLIQASQAQKHVTHNEAMAALDALVQLVVADMDRTEPPATPAEGDRHIVGAGATGDWLGKSGQIAALLGGGWVYYSPSAGWRTHVVSLGADAVFDGTDWQPVVGQGPLTTLGLNTSADTTNRLAVSAEATLLTHDGAGHQIKVNKATAADTNSLLFQTNWSGRAEMGCAGEDAWSIKVSADGTAWTTALRVDPATGLVDGAAVQDTANDTTPGRLMRADWGYGPGNLLAPVSMGAGAVPTGGVLERGTTATGNFVKMADGTLICTAEITLTQVASSRIEGTWTFPVSFIDPADLIITSHLDDDSVNDHCTPFVTSLGLRTHLPPSTTAVTFRQYRIAGMSNFASGDYALARVMAVGRWA